MSDHDKAVAKYQAWRQKLIAQLQKEPSLSERDLKGLLRPSREEHQPNIVISYLSFPIWLAKYDHALTRGMTVNLNSYRAQKTKHHADVRKQLDIIAGPDDPTRTGQALFDEIGRSRYQVFILPWVFWNMTAPGSLDPALFLKFGMNQTMIGISSENATGAVKQLLMVDLDGMPDKQDAVDDGNGTDAIINYTAHMFDSHAGAGTSGIHGPALETDEVLFHELVHASRKLFGVTAAARKVNRGYSNEEEYLAVVLSNVYLSEKGKKIFRASHSSLSALPDPEGFLNNAQYVNMEPRRLLANFKNKQPRFYRELARIPRRRARFNPVREHYDEWLGGGP